MAQNSISIEVVITNYETFFSISSIQLVWCESQFHFISNTLLCLSWVLTGTPYIPSYIDRKPLILQLLSSLEFPALDFYPSLSDLLCHLIVEYIISYTLYSVLPRNSPNLLILCFFLILRYTESDLIKLDILINGDCVEPLATIVHKDKVTQIILF